MVNTRAAENKYVVQTAHYFSICSGRRGKFAQRCCWPISRLGSEDRCHSGKTPMAAGLQPAAIDGSARPTVPSYRGDGRRPNPVLPRFDGHLSLFTSLYDGMMKELEKEAGIKPLQVWWTVTHTHSAP